MYADAKKKLESTKVWKENNFNKSYCNFSIMLSNANNKLTRSNVKVMSVRAGGGPVSIWRVETKAVSGVISSWISFPPLQNK